MRSVKGMPNKATSAKALIAANIAAKAKAGDKKLAWEILEKIRDGRNALYVDKCLLVHLLARSGQDVRAINDTVL